jgi:uncharacterized delta-60 repeat protein
MVTTFLISPPPHTTGPGARNPSTGSHRAAILACALLSLALGQAARAAPGDLDPSFDADGLVLTHFGRIDDDSVGGRNDFGTAVAVQPDGKLVVAGSSNANVNSIDVFNLSFALARYHPDGSLDTSFGSGGRVLTDFPAESSISSEDGARALVLQLDGKPVVAGGSDGRFVLARYSPDGSLDASFGSNGRVRTDFRPDTVNNSDNALALVLQPDGKLVAAGTSTFFSFTPGFFAPPVSEFALARYNPDGTLDTSFGSSGLVRTDFGGPSFGGASALVLQPDGKLVAAGSADCGLGLARYNSDGSLDPTFGSGGLVSGDCDAEEPFLNDAEALALQPDGKLVSITRAFRSSFIESVTYVLSRFNSDGTLDASFGVGGSVKPTFGSDEIFPEALVLQPDGKLVVAGATGFECFVIFGDECESRVLAS